MQKNDCEECPGPPNASLTMDSQRQRRHIVKRQHPIHLFQSWRVSVRNLKRKIVEAGTLENLPLYRNIQGRNDRPYADPGKKFHVIVKQVGTPNRCFTPLVAD